MQIYYVKDPTTGEQMYDAQGVALKMPFPPSREEALRDGLPKYYTHVPCPAHSYPGLQLSVVYAKSNIYGCCTHEHAAREFAEAKLRGEPTSTTEAAAQGKDYYWTELAFYKCGHPGKTTFKGACYECTESRANSPRQIALRQGLAWYQPASDDPCSNGHLAPRRVSNGVCKQCEEDRRPPAPEPIYKQVPDMIISYDDAVTLGFVAYRTGKPCKYGHTGWRYISTHACITCLGGK